jgi:hypothetical protein
MGEGPPEVGRFFCFSGGPIRKSRLRPPRLVKPLGLDALIAPIPTADRPGRPPLTKTG